ncbi:IS630 family transposase [Rhizophagus irregularis DAOM 181602=DAOM 197198]|nr:IS630 family transposase [Rhizophagus irregularis DAOM 181602=DAOM 197198]
MAPTSVFEMQRLTVKELWDNNIRKPSEIIKMTGSVEHLPVPGRPLVLTPKKRRYLGRLLKNDNATTSALMTTKLNNLPWSVPLLKESHVEAHLQWALNHIQDDWTHTIFSDESTFQTFHNTQIVRYKAGNPHPVHPMVKHPYKVHVWGAFCRQGPIGVALFTENMNSAKYREILQSQLLPNAYHAENVERRVNNWVMKKKSLGANDFQGIIQQEWDNIDKNLFFSLADSMSDRINMVIENNGYTINY